MPFFLYWNHHNQTRSHTVQKPGDCANRDKIPQPPPTLNLFTCADSSTNTKQIMRHLSPVTCNLSPTPTAIPANNPSPNSPTMHSRLVHQDKSQNPICFLQTNKLLKP